MTEELKSKFEEILIKEAGDLYITYSSFVTEQAMQSAYNLGKADGWVSVSDRLPDDNKRILCFDGKQIQIAKYWADTNQYLSLAIDGFMKPTHWQPLPTPPNQ